MMTLRESVAPRKAGAKAAAAVISWPAQMLWVAVLALGLYSMSPARWWLDVHAVSVQPLWAAHMSRSPSVAIDAAAGLDLTATVSAAVERQEGASWVPVCVWSSSDAYAAADGRHNRAMDLDLLSAGQCEAQALRAGTYRIRMTWRWAGPLLYIGRQAVTSNLFVVE